MSKFSDSALTILRDISIEVASELKQEDFLEGFLREYVPPLEQTVTRLLAEYKTAFPGVVDHSFDAVPSSLRGLMKMEIKREFLTYVENQKAS